MSSHSNAAVPFSLAVSPADRAALNGIPDIDFSRNLAIATAAGRGPLAMLRDVVALRIGPGQLTSNEYYYYRLWDLGVLDKPLARDFVGKIAQHRMHLACNSLQWKATADDKLLFHSIMASAGFPLPELLAVVHPTRSLPGVRCLRSVDEAVMFLSAREHYPLFAKPIEGIYSLAVLNADSITEGIIALRGLLQTAPVKDVADALIVGNTGFLIQRRLEPAVEIASAYGDRLWSVRMLVLLTPTGPVVHRATAKIPTGVNPADNYWRHGNLLGALDLTRGSILRVVTGWADQFHVIETHPDTGATLIGAEIPYWREAIDLVMATSPLLPGISTQSWDIAITKQGPVILEVNYGGDLNLSQIASGYGAMDDTLRQHLVRHGYKQV